MGMPADMMNLISIPNTTGGHLGGWRHPSSFSHTAMNLDCVIELAQLAERGKFDAVFLADGNAVRDMEPSALFEANHPSARPVSWGLYRRLATFMGHSDGNAPATISGQIGTKETTAVVEPLAFTTGLLNAARRRGAGLTEGTVESLVRSGDRVTGVRLASGETLSGDAVVIAMGPWSIVASGWLALPAVHGVKGHSLVFATGERTPQDAWFLEVQDDRNRQGEVLTPEIFPRANGTVWACAISSTQGLPVDPAQVGPDDGAHARLEALCRAVVPALANAKLVARQACFRPLTEDGLPLMGALPGAPGAYIATGHSVWGILNAPASGEAMAELVLDGAAHSVDLRPFRPDRLRPFDPKVLLSS